MEEGQILPQGGMIEAPQQLVGGEPDPLVDDDTHHGDGGPLVHAQFAFLLDGPHDDLLQ